MYAFQKSPLLSDLKIKILLITWKSDRGRVSEGNAGASGMYSTMIFSLLNFAVFCCVLNLGHIDDTELVARPYLGNLIFKKWWTL